MGRVERARVVATAAMHLDGQPLDVGNERSIAPGEHLLQVPEGPGWSGRWLRLEAGSTTQLPAGDAVPAASAASRATIERSPGRSGLPLWLVVGGGSAVVAGGVLLQATAWGPYAEHCASGPYEASPAGLSACDRDAGTATLPLYVLGVSLVGLGGLVGATGVGLTLWPMLVPDGGGAAVHVSL